MTTLAAAVPGGVNRRIIPPVVLVVRHRRVCHLLLSHQPPPLRSPQRRSVSFSAIIMIGSSGEGWRRAAGPRSRLLPWVGPAIGCRRVLPAALLSSALLDTAAPALLRLISRSLSQPLLQAQCLHDLLDGRYIFRLIHTVRAVLHLHHLDLVPVL